MTIHLKKGVYVFGKNWGAVVFENKLLFKIYDPNTYSNEIPTINQPQKLIPIAFHHSFCASLLESTVNLYLSKSFLDSLPAATLSALVAYLPG